MSGNEQALVRLVSLSERRSAGHAFGGSREARKQVGSPAPCAARYWEKQIALVYVSRSSGGLAPSSSPTENASDGMNVPVELVAVPFVENSEHG